MRIVFALFCCLTVLPVRAASTAVPTPAAWTLTLGFHSGERVAERSDEIDRVDWKLPKKRLEHFQAAGVIIDEQQRITTIVQATIVSVVHSVAVMQGQASITSVDVPRHQTQVTRSTFSAALAADNVTVPATRLQIEDAAMSGLPQAPVRLGQHWVTHMKVDTTLGSGDVEFDHTLAATDNGLLEISIRGQGQITGAEYHLPKLLPGTIALSGSAWYDPASKLIVRESYAIHNRLIKPMEGEDSGFDERLSVDTSTRSVNP
jgi:hypothetical protein